MNSNKVPIYGAHGQITRADPDAQPFAPAVAAIAPLAPLAPLAAIGQEVLP